MALPFPTIVINQGIMWDAAKEFYSIAGRAYRVSRYESLVKNRKLLRVSGRRLQVDRNRVRESLAIFLVAINGLAQLPERKSQLNLALALDRIADHWHCRRSQHRQDNHHQDN